MSSSFKFAVANTVSKISTILATVLLSIFLARILGPEKYGIYRTLRSIPTSFVGLTTFFSVHTLIYFTSKTKEKHKVFWTAFITNLFISLTIFLFILLFSNQLALKYSVSRVLILLASLELIFVSTFPVFLSYAKGLGIFTKSAFLQILYNIFRTFVVFVALFSGLFGIFVWRNIYSIFIIFLASLSLLKFLKKPSFDFQLFRKMFVYNTFLVFNSAIIQFVVNYPILFLGKIDPKEVSYYSIAFFMATFITIFYQSLSEIGLLRLANVKEEYEVMRKLTKYSTYLAGFSFSAFLAFGGEVINLLFSNKYLPAVLPLYILSLTFFINSTVVGINTYLLSREKAYIASISLLPRLILTLVLTPLIEKYKAVGAALVFSIALFSSIIYVNIYASIRKINAGRIYSVYSILASVPAIFLGKFLSKLLPTVTSVFIVPPLTFMTYVFILALLKGFDEYDLYIARTIFNKIRRELRF